MSRDRIKTFALALVAIAAATLGLAAPVGDARPAGHAGTARWRGASPALFNREALGYGSTLGLRAEARRYSVMVLQVSDGRLVRPLHGYNRRVKIFLYTYMAFARTVDPTAQVNCTSLSQDARHPNWFLKAAGGVGPDLISAPDRHVMDIGNPAYQQACIAHAIAQARQFGFDGVYLDGLSTKLAYLFPSYIVPHSAAYPTDASWQAANYSFLRYAGAVVHAHGLLLFANIGGAQQRLWRLWNGPLDGAEEESWADGGFGLAQWLWWWPKQLANVAWSEAHGKDVVLHSHNTSQAGNVYGLASMLLVANGHSTYSTANGGYYHYEAWYPEYTTAERLGRPLGPYRRVRGGVYERLFAAGIVLVNPSTHPVGRIWLGGLRYGPGHGRRASLGPTSALIMLATG
jgi:hypothetical protein